MKKVSCLTATILFLVSAVTAQQTQFGVKGGVNISSVDNKNGDDFASKAGVHLGGLAHIHITQHFAIQPELVYSMQGGKDGNEELKLNYINVPVLAQYMTHEGLRLETGPQLGFLTSAKSKIDDVEIDQKDDLNSVDFSWTFGAGFLFPSGFGIDARYNHGIGNISDDNSFEAKNRVFQIGLFYQFMNGKTSRHR